MKLTSRGVRSIGLILEYKIKQQMEIWVSLGKLLVSPLRNLDYSSSGVSGSRVGSLVARRAWKMQWKSMEGEMEAVDCTRVHWA